ncbi:hypothetical protein [Peribacillus sp. SCS-155]|uniref:hypothetical protein n=1 Tax=Peribacillus sedimenti TaxID=3115297 RepID=UPI0039059832
METTCVLCGKGTKDRVSYLELEAWEFEFVQAGKQDFYNVCFDCFDTHTNQFIDQDMDLELRKKRSMLVKKEIQEEIEAILDLDK